MYLVATVQALPAQCSVHVTSCRNDYRRHLIATKAEYYCTMVDEAGRNMKKLFDVTNTLLGRTTPTQFPYSTDGVPLPERFNTFFVDKISRIICRIDARAEPTVTEYQAPRLHGDLTRFNKIAIQGTPQMAVDKEAISLSRVYSYDSKYTCPYSMCNPP